MPTVPPGGPARKPEEVKFALSSSGFVPLWQPKGGVNGRYVELSPSRRSFFQRMIFFHSKNDSVVAVFHSKNDFLSFKECFGQGCAGPETRRLTGRNFFPRGPKDEKGSTVVR